MPQFAEATKDVVFVDKDYLNVLSEQVTPIDQDEDYTDDDHD